MTTLNRPRGDNRTTVWIYRRFHAAISKFVASHALPTILVGGVILNENISFNAIDDFLVLLSHLVHFLSARLGNVAQGAPLFAIRLHRGKHG